MAIPDADTILGALALARPGIVTNEKAVRAGVQHARSLSRWPVDEPAAIFFAFASRPRAVPSLNAQLAVFLAREQVIALRLTLLASDADLRTLLNDVQTRTASFDDIRAWFADRMPAD